jgi:hypothetical protein
MHMNHRTRLALGAITLAAGSASAFPPFTIDWYTIDGGGEMGLSGGDFALSGTIGQPDASALNSGGPFGVIGGFWGPFEVFCPADFNKDGQVDFFDYLDFVAAFDAENITADFNGDNQVDFFDYLDFAAAFDLGC